MSARRRPARSGSPETLRHLEGCPAWISAAGEIAELVKAPREASLDLDALRIVGPDRLERRAEDIGADAESLLVARTQPRNASARARSALCGRP